MLPWKRWWMQLTGKHKITKRLHCQKDDQLCELSRALAVLASASSVSREREEFLRLVNKEIELYNTVVDKEGKEGEAEAKEAYKAVREGDERRVRYCSSFFSTDKQGGCYSSKT